MAKSSAKRKQEIVEAVSQETLPAISQSFGNFKVKAMVTLPTFKIQDNEAVVFIVDGAMYEGKKLKDDDKDKKPAFIMPVSKVNPETGETLKGQIVVGTVLRENLLEKYPDDGYVGRTFGILKYAAKDGKRYKEYQILELEAQD